MNIVFLGSFKHYSAKILQALVDHPGINVAVVVTTPPKPVGRKQVINQTPVHELAEKLHIPVITPSTLDAHALDYFDKLSIDYFVTAGYGKFLPSEWLSYPEIASLNLHFSLLPAYRGANPAEWAIMCGETETGITLMKMNEGWDTGDIITQASLPISSTDTRETLYDKLYTLGAQMLPEWLVNNSGVSKAQEPDSPTPYAALLKRDDGFVPWTTIQNSLRGLTLQVEDFPSKKLQTALNHVIKKSSFLEAQDPKGASIAKSLIEFISRLPRALAGYPSLWTIVPTTKGDKRMKIITYNDGPQLIQIEGQQPSAFNQIKNQLRQSATLK